ncbi:MAG: phosphoribosylformylglycinamidine synthase II, partial [Deltaproteobacteria bacterium]|nr:phosphoribosylformylglycinamidine synthase II [Deltaproteobacteria bacterium]
REAGMTPYEMLLSESQERMLMVVKKGREKEVEAIFKKWDLNVAVVGRVTNSKRMVITFKGETVVDVPVDPLAEAAPIYDRPVKKPGYIDEITREVVVDEPADYKEMVLKILASPTIADKSWVYQQYDHMVMTGTVQGPGSDAAVVRIGDTGKAVSLTVNCNSRYVYLNPRMGAAIAVAESGRNIVCSGALPLAVTDCLNFGNPEKGETMWEFVEACEGMSEACREFNTPVVSGNVSFYNETSGKGIYPTPTIGMVGLLKNLKEQIGISFKDKGDLIVLLGETYPEIGGSEYLKLVTGKICGPCPELDFIAEKNLWATIGSLNKSGLIKSAHDVSEGGLIVSLLESSFANHLGFKIEIHSDLRPDEYLFGESQSRAVVTVAKQHVKKALAVLAKGATPYLFLGEAKEERAFVLYNSAVLLDEQLSDFHKVYEAGFESGVFKRETGCLL